MTGLDKKTLNHLIQADRVHRRVYTDPEIFELEMERVFGTAWVFVGHESHVPKPGDFFTTRVGRQPVVMVRHTDGKVHVLYNRCGHRGAVVENLPKGNAKHFRCCYHGWVFKTNGELASVPLKNGYPEDFDLTDPMLGMVPLPRVENYRGFVFASLSDSGPGLATALGGAITGIDDICNRAPNDEVEIVGGMHKYLFRGNWKFQIENVIDGYHAISSHESTVSEERQFQRRGGDSAGPKYGETTETESPLDKLRVWGFDYGHSCIGHLDMGDERSGKTYERYKARMIAKKGIKRTQEILGFDRFNTAFYPNLIIQALSQHIRVIHPISVDLTEIHIFPMHLKGAPREMLYDAVRFLNITHSPASMVQTDDLEAFKRCHAGLSSQGNDWVVMSRGLGEDRADKILGGFYSRGTHEIGMRHQYRAWKSYMGA